ncbi:unannotated protein [freshwater metagenome]|uniref:Unannotated protein n=1 Tax=freshwater metagenome TaxID=449393 RepID=A0A6J6NFN1_9ZZZZ
MHNTRLRKIARGIDALHDHGDIGLAHAQRNG